MSDMYSGEGSRLAAGTKLNGIFEIDRRIASGGMGEIYRGHAIETGDPVALKVMRTDLADNTMALALFRKEASALHYIHHEAIVRYYIFSHDPGTGRHYLAMEFVDGQPLSELLQRGPLGFEAVRLLQERLAAGLNAAHQHGIIHRDLSPDNVLIPGGDLARAKIIDFGIARSTRVGDGTIIGSGFAGKYNYVSPEQLGLFGGDVTAKSDIYSLGLVLAQCLTGQPINMGGTQFEILEKRRSLPDLGAIDRRFRPLLEQMLQPNPADRPESMAAVAAWRPKPETSPPVRGAATRDRSRDAGPATGDTPKSKLALGRQMTMGALAVALLLGVGSVGFYFAKDIISPPVSGPARPPELDPSIAKQRDEEAKRRAEEDERRRNDAFKRAESQGLIGPGPLSPRERPPADPKERITQFVDAYDGGDCFFVATDIVAEGKATLEGFGSSVAPFEVLDYEFKRQHGFEASIGVHQVMPEQCAAVSFLSRTKNQPGMAPRLDIVTAGLRNGGPLTGTVAEFGNRNVELLLVADDGYVHNLSALLKPNGNVKTFSIGIKKTNPGPPRPQLLFAIVSSKPLDALKLPQLGSPAEQIFAQALAEALQSGQAVNVSAKYFMLEK
jgi:serine/threonine-protein kinase